MHLKVALQRRTGHTRGTLKQSGHAQCTPRFKSPVQVNVQSATWISCERGEQSER